MSSNDRCNNIYEMPKRGVTMHGRAPTTSQVFLPDSSNFVRMNGKGNHVQNDSFVRDAEIQNVLSNVENYVDRADGFNTAYNDKIEKTNNRCRTPVENGNPVSNLNVSTITIGERSEYCKSPYPAFSTPSQSYEASITNLDQDVNALSGRPKFGYQRFDNFPNIGTAAGSGGPDLHERRNYQFQQQTPVTTQQQQYHYRTRSEAEQIEHMLQFCSIKVPTETNQSSSPRGLCATPSVTLGGSDCVPFDNYADANKCGKSHTVPLRNTDICPLEMTAEKTTKREVEEQYDGVSEQHNCNTINNTLHHRQSFTMINPPVDASPLQSCEQTCYEPLTSTNGWYDSNSGYGVGDSAVVTCGSPSECCENTNSSAISKYRIQYDQSPNILKRHTGKPVAYYRQHISVRYLQPPAPPPPGPIIIKEVRGAEPQPAPPIIVRQKPQEPMTPPPLVLREKPPPPPCVPATQVLVKRLPPPPPPPRQVVIERYPPLPPKPRDIIIEKWLPYKQCTQRPVLLQKAPLPCPSKPPKNVIIQYIAHEAHVDRVYRQLGVVQANPCVYAQQHGGQLIDPAQLQATAMKEGIFDAIKAPFLPQTSDARAVEYGGQCVRQQMVCPDLCNQSIQPLSGSLVELTCPPTGQVASWLGCVNMDCSPNNAASSMNNCYSPQQALCSFPCMPNLYQPTSHTNPHVQHTMLDAHNQVVLPTFSHSYIPPSSIPMPTQVQPTIASSTVQCSNVDFNNDDWNFLQDPY